MSVALQMYQRLPVWSRSLAASLQGFYLRRWRYDGKTEKQVEAILERDHWSEREWQDWQDNRLSYILHRAATKVPYYRESWAKRRRNGDKASFEYLENWEILEKQTLRDRAREFISNDCVPTKMYRDHTSGTTGTSLNIWSSRETIKLWYALFEARCRRAYDVSRFDRWGIFGGQLVVPVKQAKPPFWVWNAGLNQLYLSSYHLSPELSKYYLDALARYRVTYILGYSSAIYALAQDALRERRKLQMKVVISNAEPLFDYQKRTISEAFNCPVRETYGMAEMAAAASECPHGKLHQWLDAGVVENAAELMNADESTSEAFEFICTGLINHDMPLIRYRIGDSGAFSRKKCKCIRAMPVIDKIEGRTDDLLYTAAGKRIGRLDPVFKQDLPIIEAQIIQKSLKKIVVRYVAGEGFNSKSAKDLTLRLHERLGDMEILLEEVTKIPRTNRGKFRAVICELPGEERALVNSTLST